MLPSFYQDGYINVLRFMKQIQDEGLANRDFMATNQANVRQAFFQGRAGIVGGMIGMISDGAFDAVFNNPGARMAPLGAFRGPDGVLSVDSQANFNALYMMPRPSVRTQAQAERILEFFNRTMDQEVFNLFVIGVEGVHHRIENNQPVIIDQARLTLDLAPMLSLYVRPQIMENLRISQREELRVGYQMQVGELRNYLPTQLFFIPTVPTAQLDQIMNDANLRFVAGDINEVQWRAALDEWRRAGGTALIADYTAQNRARSR
jgi:putative aldouronate transport system substrate-binding protein